jgi:hypothetical protein
MRRFLLAAGLALVAAVSVAMLIHDGAARAVTVGTPTNVSPYGCIFGNGGHVTRPAGSTIVIRNGYASTRLGIQGFLLSQVSMVGVNDGVMSSVPSASYGKPTEYTIPGLSGQYWVTYASVDTGITLANAGDEMRFTFAQVFKYPFPDVDQNGNTVIVKAGFSFGGTCTVKAT